MTEPSHRTSTSLTWEEVRLRPRGSRPLVMAHRGAAEELPENTLASFGLALDQGAEVLETDLRFTRDNAIVLVHDGSLDRTTDSHGTVSEMTLAEVRRARARRSFEPEKGLGRGDEPIATLDDLLEFNRGRVPLALELKDDKFAEPEGAQMLLNALDAHSARRDSCVLSFSLPRIRQVKALAPEMPIGLITLNRILPNIDTELVGPYWPLLITNPFYVSWARRLGKIVGALDPNPEPRLGYYRFLGVPVVLSNHPGRTRRALE